MAKFIILFIGIFSCSTAVILIKASTTHPALLASYRLLIAAILLTPVFLRELNNNRESYSLKHIKRTFLPGLFLGLHFITWIIGARLTMAANASLIININPIAMPFFLYFLLKEKLKKTEIIGTILAISGLVMMATADFKFGREHFLGDMLCFISMLFSTCYLALGRKNRDFPNLWLYVVPLYYFAGIFCFVIAIFFVSPIQSYPTREIFLIFGLAVIPTVIGHSVFNYSLKHIRGQIIVIINLSTQFVLAAIMAYFFFGEIPRSMFYFSAIFLISGALLTILTHAQIKQRTLDIKQKFTNPEV